MADDKAYAPALTRVLGVRPDAVRPSSSDAVCVRRQICGLLDHPLDAAVGAIADREEAIFEDVAAELGGVDERA